MLRLPYSLWLLPTGTGRKKPYPSRFKMNPQQARLVGALSIIPGTTEYREVPETEEERQQAPVHYPSAGHDSVQPPRK